MDDDQQFCLRWNNHQSTLISVFDTLLENETLVDCTLAAEGKFLKAHKVVLSACSPYFATLLQEQYDKHPIFILKDVKYQELRAMMDYMYRGEVNISQDQLTALLKAAESLQIKGLSDNRSGTGPAAAAAAQQQQAPKPDTHHRVKLSAPYTLEQTKRARITTGGAAVGVGGMVDAGDVAGSREGSSSPSRRRRKVRRRSMENDMHDNSNSSVLAAASNQSILQQTSAGLAASALVSTQLASGSGVASATVAAAAGSGTGSQVINQPLTSSSSSSSNVTKKTESAKLTSTAAAQGAQQQQQQQQQQQTTSDAINTDNVQQQQQNQGAQGEAEEMDVASGGAASGAVAVHPGVVKQLTTLDKSNHKQKIKDNSITTTEMVIEPKAEYDDDAHDENVEDLTLDEEDMTMEELDQAAGTSQGGEGSSQAYATWQHDRSQDELGLMAAQDAQQRDPQDIYPILGSLLGVDTSTNVNASSGLDTSIGDFYGYISNNNSNSNNNNNNSSSNNNNSSSTHIHVTASASNASAASSNVLRPGHASSQSRDSFMQCKHCNRYYKSHQKLQEHVRKYCLKQKKYKCVSCEYRSRRKDHVLRHAKRKHCMLYERLRHDEESLYLIRNEDDQSNDDNDNDNDGDNDNDNEVEDADGGGMDSDVAAALCEINFDFAGRDLTITAVPMLQESDEDDDDYDEDG
ncbi:longitudinals lacking protein, isoforms H/M/V isoform X8 [Drosophila navojoa]|uniref:longitudinals lacking protein, isoforms H/M/V isoform X8 n=1 Tax=Drosophila navojoa TaxID=7232 RepID=UPI000846C16D|nr:longitudinals lacking protein, isoforms H/M/V isoform X8 [Drosophila navojoa]